MTTQGKPRETDKCYFERLVDSYGIFARNFTGADMYLSKEGYPEAASYSLSNTFQLGRFSISTYVTIYLPERKVMVLLNARDDQTDKYTVPHASVEVPKALQKGFMETEIKKVMKQLVPEMTAQDFRLLPFTREMVHLNEVARELHQIGRNRGYLSFHVNNYKKISTAHLDLRVGTPTGNVTSRLQAVLVTPDVIGNIHAVGVTRPFPYHDLSERNALVKALKDYGMFTVEPRRDELLSV